MSQDTEWLVAINTRGTAARLVGEFDLTNAGVPRGALATMVHPERQVIVDVAGVTFCWAALLRSLIDSQAPFARSGTHLALTPMSPERKRVLEITATDSLFLVEL
jgi:anti-anti-sigma regulatory factor